MESKEEVLLINNEIRVYLLDTVKWTWVLLIAGYIVTAILLYVAIINFGTTSDFTKFYITDLFSMGYVYMFLVFVSYYPLSYLRKFCKKIKKGLNSDNQELITSGFKNLKSLYKFMRTLMIVFLILGALGILVALRPNLFPIF